MVPNEPSTHAPIPRVLWIVSLLAAVITIMTIITRGATLGAVLSAFIACGGLLLLLLQYQSRPESKSLQ